MKNNKMASDLYSYEKSLRGSDSFSPMLKKEILYVSDQNSSYSGQIQVDTSQLANSNKWLDYSEAYLEVPFIVALQSSTDISAASMNGFTVGLKSGSWQIIDSMQVALNGQNVIQQTPYTNFYCSYKAMTSWSQDALVKHGDSVVFAPDSVGGSYNVGAAAAGNGYSNNVVAPVPAVLPIVWTTTSGVLSNEGFLRRLRQTSYPPASYGPNGLLASLTSTANLQQIAKNYFSGAGANAARVYQWVMTLTIRLKDLADFFAKLPLLRGVQMAITLNYNSCVQTVTSVAAGPTLVQGAPTMLSGRTNPLMMSASVVGNPMNLPVAGGAGGVFTIGCGIKSTASPASTLSGPLSSCRLYVPAYILAPEDEARYLSIDRMKKIVYSDIQQYIVSNVGVGSTFNQLLTNGLAGLEQIICMPVMNASAGNYATIALQPYQSIFDPCPACTSPLAALTQFNVLLSGSNIFQQNEQYDFQQFRDELSQSGALNGGKSDLMSSGLISQGMWDNLYRYYVADLSRRVAAEDMVPKSVAVQGINSSDKILDIICFLKFRREITIDVASGTILSV